MIQHVSLEVNPADAEDCVAFWRLLAFEPVDPPATLTERSRWVQRGPTQVHLLFVDMPTRMPEGHVAVVVDDYAATVAALEAAGHGVLPRAEHWGSPRCYTRCPAGHRVEVMASAP